MKARFEPEGWEIDLPEPPPLHYAYPLEIRTYAGRVDTDDDQSFTSRTELIDFRLRSITNEVAVYWRS